MSTDGILFYGYCWHEEGSLLPAGEEWDVLVLRRRGVRRPWDDYPGEAFAAMPHPEREQFRARWLEDNRAALDDWLARREAVEKEFGVEPGHHCSGDYAMPYLAAAGSRTTAYRGRPKEIDPARLAAGPDWDAKLDRWLAEFGVAKPDGQDRPRWWLVSYWG